jgi:anti-sigma regulatory factor (Ser/Thr protein kinase)
MSNLKSEKILSVVRAEDFIGRTGELESILRHAERSSDSARGLLLSSAPSAGASELLKQVYDRLFLRQTEIIPFYFALEKSDRTAKNAAVRFLTEFLRQTIAFRRRDAKILDYNGDVNEMAQIAAPGDGYWIDRTLETFQNKSKFTDERSFVRQILSTTARAATGGVKVFAIFDDLHESENFAGKTDFFEELQAVFERSDAPFAFAGRRRFLFAAARGGNYEILPLEPLSFSDAGRLAENLAGNFDVEISEQARDLIAAQTGGNPRFIKFLLQAASERRKNLNSFSAVEKIYADEVFGGRIGKFYDAAFKETTANVETQKNITALLFDALTLEKEKTPIESWQNRVGLSEPDFYRMMRRLNTREIVRVSSNQVEAMAENGILSDYITARFRLEIAGEKRALVVAESLSVYFKRAPKTMARFYRRGSAINLRELLTAFDRQQVPLALIDYSRFRAEYKGAPNEELQKTLAKDEEKIRLPQVFYAAHTASFYQPIEQSIERERSAVALGFNENRYTDEDEIVWIAAEIDSKLEASKELTEFWCDRLEIVAMMCNFLKYRIWLLAAEGFSPEAVEVLRRRSGFGASRQQVELLISHLQMTDVLGEKLKPNEYEMIVPIGEDTEMIAAQTVEEIARRHHFPAKAINQIKTAFVEACINASEHSDSPDRKIYQKFAVEKDKLVITIANRGLRLTDKKQSMSAPKDGRRGWGLKLMETLMDEVKFVETDDGTSISMTKYLAPVS